jgi:type I restriction enzyme S subunit
VKLPAYPEYKPSDVEWLGDVPVHWEVKRLKYSASINDEALPETTSPDFEFEYVDIGGVSAVDGITATEQVVFENAPSRARRRVRHGDTIVSTVRTYLRAIAPIKNPPENLIVSTGFAVVRPRKIEPAFLAYALHESSFVESVVACSVGVSYPACNASEVGGIAIPLPDPTEQRAIAAFLDRETGRVDRLVAKKRELIERLKEKRTALISRTVTRGLPPAAARAAGLPETPPLKPSGTEWLGEIPEHWEVKKGRYVGTLFGSASPSEDEFIEDDIIQDGDLPFAKVDDLNQIDGSLKLVSTKARVRGCRARPGAFLLFPKRGAAIFTNKVAITEKPLLFDSNLMGWQINSGFALKFVAYCLIARRLDDLADVSTVPQINNKHIYPAAFPRPPLPEQTAIAAYLDLETAKLDALAGKVEAAVERLQEYRTALITAAVTGKIDVRKAAA